MALVRCFPETDTAEIEIAHVAMLATALHTPPNDSALILWFAVCPRDD